MRGVTQVVFVLMMIFIISCGGDGIGDWPREYYTDWIIPEIVSSTGGVLSSPPPSDYVYYYNYLHRAEESDIQMDNAIRGYQQARRYLFVSGTATPDDSGFSDRYYHSVLFRIVAPDDSVSYITLPVDRSTQFEGYLYFRQTGINNVYAFRALDDTLYPRSGRGTTHVVQEMYPTLRFRVDVQEAVPAGLTNLIPTMQVNNGNQAIRAAAQQIVYAASAVSDYEKVEAVYNFLIDGDEVGKFVYTYYDQIYPGYLELSYNSIFLASHFLYRRVGVCNDFAELFAALVRSLGIPVTKVSGNASDGGGHMWNRVYFDGLWWWLDATWANGAVAAGYPAGRNAQAEWRASDIQKDTFLAEHDHTYSNKFSIEY